VEKKSAVHYRPSEGGKKLAKVGRRFWLVIQGNLRFKGKRGRYYKNGVMAGTIRKQKPKKQKQKTHNNTQQTKPNKNRTDTHEGYSSSERGKGARIRARTDLLGFV